MSDTTEIERLRKLLSDTNTYYAECIAEREELRAENEKLRAALKAFVPDTAITDPALPDSRPIDVLVRVGDLRAARAALKETGDE